MTDQGGFDLGGLLQQAQAMQEEMAAAQEVQAQQIVTGSAGGGKVTVEITGAGVFNSISIAPDVVDPEDIEMLEDLILAAIRDGSNQVADIQESSMESMQMPDLGGLGDMLGGA